MGYRGISPYSIEECKNIIANIASARIKLGIYGLGYSYILFKDRNAENSEVTIKFSAFKLSQAEIEGYGHGKAIITAVCQGKINLSAEKQGTFFFAETKYMPFYPLKYLLAIISILLIMFLLSNFNYLFILILFFFGIFSLTYTIFARLMFLSIRKSFSPIMNNIVEEISSVNGFTIV